MFLDRFPEAATVLIDARSGRRVSRRDVDERVSRLRTLRGDRPLAFLFCDNSVDNTIDFLALLELRWPVALVDPRLDRSMMSGLLQAYRPELVIGTEPGDPYSLLCQRVWGTAGGEGQLHEDLSVLLTTSGSTGSPKFVRLSFGNIHTNARQIAQSLAITRHDLGVTALPLFYSFGMSIITSHVSAGSPVLVTDRGLLEHDFWEDLATHRVTFFPGVPQTYSMLTRLGFDKRNLPHLRALIQAGGRLADDVVGHFDDLMRSRGGEFFVMYGQTEASPRIACLPPERLADKLGSAGVALPGGRLYAADETGELASGESGEIVYSGPNVMMGYAQSRDDLALGDLQGFTLRTGDTGYVDSEGFLFLTGRTKRIAKLAGERVSLDEVENLASGIAPVAAVAAGDEGVVLYSEKCLSEDLADVRRDLARQLRVAVKLLRIEHIAELPLLSNGKVDYTRLTRQAKGE